MKNAFKKKQFKEVNVKVTPFGFFAYQNGKLIKKQIWKKEDFIGNYLKKEDLLKEFKGKIGKAKYEIEHIFGEEAEKFAKKQNVHFDFQNFMIGFTKYKIKSAFSKDKLIIQASNMHDELSKIINMFYERLSEWYGLYWPEKVKEIEHVEDFAQIVGEERKGQSMGFDIDSEDLEIIKKTGEEIKNLISMRKGISEYIKKEIEKIAPNVSKIAGHNLGAKLISAAGSLKKFALMPSSTIQVLGAEKALFRHIRKGAKPPKHGIILSHELMSKVKKENRGKLARILASKLSMAAKIDFYSNGQKEEWKEMLEEINKRADDLK